MLFSKRGQVSAQVFGFIFVLVVISFTIYFGFNLISNTQDKIDTADLTLFVNSIKDDLNSISSEYGTFRKLSYPAPGEIELCFADLDQDDKEKILKTELIKSYPFIRDILVGGEGKNMFVIYDDRFDSYKLEGIEIRQFPHFKCFKPELGKINFGAEGLGKETMIITDFEVKAKLTGEEITVESADGIIEMIIPEGVTAYINNDPNQPIDEISIKMVDVSTASGNQASDVYMFGPSGATFVPSITLKIKYNPNTAADGCPTKLTFYQTYDDGSPKSDVDAIDIDCDNHIATFEISGFSYGFTSDSEDDGGENLIIVNKDGSQLSENDLNKIMDEHPFSHLYEPGSILIKYNSDPNFAVNDGVWGSLRQLFLDEPNILTDFDSVNDLNNEFDIESFEELSGTPIDGIKLYRLQFSENVNIEDILDSYNSDPNVVYADPLLSDHTDIVTPFITSRENFQEVIDTAKRYNVLDDNELNDLMKAAESSGQEVVLDGVGEQTGEEVDDIYINAILEYSTIQLSVSDSGEVLTQGVIPIPSTTTRDPDVSSAASNLADLIPCEVIGGFSTNFAISVVPCGFDDTNQGDLEKFDRVSKKFVEALNSVEPFKSNNVWSIYKVNDYSAKKFHKSDCWNKKEELIKLSSLCGFDQIVILAHCDYLDFPDGDKTIKVGGIADIGGKFSIVCSGLDSTQEEYAKSYFTHELGHSFGWFAHTNGGNKNKEKFINCGEKFEVEDKPCEEWQHSFIYSWVEPNDPQLGCYKGCADDEKWFSPWKGIQGIMGMIPRIEQGYTPVERYWLATKLGIPTVSKCGNSVIDPMEICDSNKLKDGTCGFYSEDPDFSEGYGCYRKCQAKQAIEFKTCNSVNCDSYWDVPVVEGESEFTCNKYCGADERCHNKRAATKEKEGSRCDEDMVCSSLCNCIMGEICENIGGVCVDSEDCFGDPGRSKNGLCMKPKKCCDVGTVTTSSTTTTPPTIQCDAASYTNCNIAPNMRHSTSSIMGDGGTIKMGMCGNHQVYMYEILDNWECDLEWRLIMEDPDVDYDLYTNNKPMRCITTEDVTISNNGPGIEDRVMLPNSPSGLHFATVRKVSGEGSYTISGQVSNCKVIVTPPITTLPCDSSSYTTCDTAYITPGGLSTSKGDMCGDKQYYKVEIGENEICDIQWELFYDRSGPFPVSDYDLTAYMNPNKCGVDWGTDSDHKPTGIDERVFLNDKPKGLYLAYVEKISGNEPYSIAGLKLNCKPEFYCDDNPGGVPNYYKCVSVLDTCQDAGCAVWTNKYECRDSTKICCKGCDTTTSTTSTTTSIISTSTTTTICNYDAQPDGCSAYDYCDNNGCVDCLPFRGNCDRTKGCEVNLLWDENNCNFCGNDCGAGKICDQGNCKCDIPDCGSGLSCVGSTCGASCTGGRSKCMSSNNQIVCCSAPATTTSTTIPICSEIGSDLSGATQSDCESVAGCTWMWDDIGRIHFCGNDPGCSGGEEWCIYQNLCLPPSICCGLDRGWCGSADPPRCMPSGSLNCPDVCPGLNPPKVWCPEQNLCMDSCPSATSTTTIPQCDYNANPDKCYDVKKFCFEGNCIDCDIRYGYNNCDGTKGCEAHLADDEMNCGRCGKECGARGRCVSSNCISCVADIFSSCRDPMVFSDEGIASNICQDRYFLYTVPAFIECDVEWALESKGNADYDLYIDNRFDPCPKLDWSYESTKGIGLIDSYKQLNVQPGRSILAKAEKKTSSGSGLFDMTLNLDCRMIGVI